MVRAGDAEDLAATISRCIADPERLAAMSAENLVRASRFAGPEIERKRAAFYEHFMGVVERHAAG